MSQNRQIRIDFPATRNTDPRTSLDAERCHRIARRENVAKVIDFVKSHPGWVATEIASALGMDRHETSRRLADAKSINILKIEGSRYGNGGTRKQSIWYEV